jgi:hypothetical protein
MLSQSTVHASPCGKTKVLRSVTKWHQLLLMKHKSHTCDTYGRGCIVPPYSQLGRRSFFVDMTIEVEVEGIAL